MSTPWDPPGSLRSLMISPVTFLASTIHTLVLTLRGWPSLPVPKGSRIRIVCLSDTHDDTIPACLVPSGDLLIHCGDLTNNGRASAIQAQIDWLNSLPHQHKIVIAGNHDSYLDPSTRLSQDKDVSLDWKSVHYLQHSEIILAFAAKGARKLKVYGAPQIPACGPYGPGGFAFQYERGQDAWSETIPKDTDILVTHTPPKYHCDLATGRKGGMGCEWLTKEASRVKPKVQICGHVHSGHGQEPIWWDRENSLYESICDRIYKQKTFVGESKGLEALFIMTVGIIKELIDIWAWFDLARLVVYGVFAIVWTRIWGGNGNTSMLVNAALSYRTTGKLGNPIEVVEI